MKKFKWIAKSDDGAFEDESTKVFDSKKDCYEDMRNLALEKMKWNTEYDDDFSYLLDDDYIGYEVKFKQDEIVHTSYSGVYTYKIVEVKNYIVNAPFSGTISFEVEATDEDDAFDIAIKMQDEGKAVTEKDIVRSAIFDALEITAKY